MSFILKIEIAYEEFNGYISNYSMFCTMLGIMTLAFPLPLLLGFSSFLFNELTVRSVVNLRYVKPRVVVGVAHPKKYFSIEILICNYM